MTDETHNDDDAVRAAAERPARRRARMWDHADRIRTLLDDGRSYGQIVRMLKLNVSASRLGKWCRAVGIIPPRVGPHAHADKTSAAPAVQPAPARDPLSIAEMLDAEERARAALAAQFFKPRTTP